MPKMNKKFSITFLVLTLFIILLSPNLDFAEEQKKEISEKGILSLFEKLGKTEIDTTEPQSLKISLSKRIYSSGNLNRVISI